jgi:hypothetical protein
LSVQSFPDVSAIISDPLACLIHLISYEYADLLSFDEKYLVAP